MYKTVEVLRSGYIVNISKIYLRKESLNNISLDSCWISLSQRALDLLPRMFFFDHKRLIAMPVVRDGMKAAREAGANATSSSNSKNIDRQPPPPPKEIQADGDNQRDVNSEVDAARGGRVSTLAGRHRVTDRLRERRQSRKGLGLLSR